MFNKQTFFSIIATFIPPLAATKSLKWFSWKLKILRKKHLSFTDFRICRAGDEIYMILLLYLLRIRSFRDVRAKSRVRLKNIEIQRKITKFNKKTAFEIDCIPTRNRWYARCNTVLFDNPNDFCSIRYLLRYFFFVSTTTKRYDYDIFFFKRTRKFSNVKCRVQKI